MPWLVGAALAALLAPPADAVTALMRDMDTSYKERPVMKVVRMLQDMAQELQTDLDDDKRIHQKMDCWCATNKKEKTQAVDAGQARVSELEALIGQLGAKSQDLQTKAQAAKTDLADDKTALNNAGALRIKEQKDFQKDETRLRSAIQAVDQAIIVLKKHHPDFAQVRSVVRRLQRAKVLSLGALGAQRTATLRSFLQEGSPGQGGSFRGYAPQSGQIFGILTQLKVDFERSLKELLAQEQKAAADFVSMKAAKQDQIKVGENMVRQLEDEFADSNQKRAQAEQELADTRDQLGSDMFFLHDLKDKCSQSDAEFDARVKSRMDEITAVEDTIQILNDDKSFDVFDKTVNSGSFLQIADSTSAQNSEGSSTLEELRRRRRAAGVLQRAAAEGGPRAAGLSLLAGRLQDPAFGKVTAEIDKMLMTLKAQQQDEVDQKDWCVKEMNENARSTAAANDTKADLEVKKADIQQTMTTMEKTLKDAKAQLADTEAQMKQASEIREAENADFQKTATDQRLAQMVLQKALTRMKQVYLFMQQPMGPPGTSFGNYTKHAGGGRVVAALEMIIANAKQAEAQALAGEKEGQEMYEMFMKESNQGIVAYNQQIMDLTAALAKSKQELAVAKADIQRLVDELDNLSDELGDLHKSCDYILQNFDARQRGRLSEMNALGQAKYILSGMQ